MPRVYVEKGEVKRTTVILRSAHVLRNREKWSQSN